MFAALPAIDGPVSRERPSFAGSEVGRMQPSTLDVYRRYESLGHPYSSGIETVSTLLSTYLERCPMKRQLPNPRALASLVKLKTPRVRSKANRLHEALTIWDLRAIAMHRTPSAVFDYTEGAADSEISMLRSRQAYEDIQFNPNVLRDVSNVDLSSEVLGGPTTLPFGIAPTGFTRMMHTEGEWAGAGAAGNAGIPFSLSTLGTVTIENVKSANPCGRNWFQLYMCRDRERSMSLVERAASAGFDTLIVTVDVPFPGDRLRDRRNGLTFPPQLTLRVLGNTITKPAWCLDFLTTEALSFAMIDKRSDAVSDFFDPSVTFDDLNWIKDQWPGKVIVKGVQSVIDARRLANIGVDAITVSNHGGRQLDRSTTPFHLLPEIVREVGMDLEVHTDSGIMSGADIVAAIALGARFTLIGRAYLYGLMAGGRSGVDRTIEILAGQITRTMQLLGVRHIGELSPRHVTQLKRLWPAQENRRNA